MQSWGSCLLPAIVTLTPYLSQSGIPCRVSYWLDIPVVSPDALQQLLKDGPSADTNVNHSSGAVGQKGSGSHVPPALEIGIAESGQLAVQSAPALPAAASHTSPQQPTLELALDFASLDTESMLLSAAAANAGVQLGTRSHHTTPLAQRWDLPWHYPAPMQACIMWPAMSDLVLGVHVASGVSILCNVAMAKAICG